MVTGLLIGVFVGTNIGLIIFSLISSNRKK